MDKLNPVLPSNALQIKAELISAESALEAAGIETPRFEVQLLLALALGVSRTQVIAQTYSPVTNRQWQSFSEYIRLRVARTPLAYIRGTQEFYGLDFRVDRNCLIPRPETEMLVDYALSCLSKYSDIIDFTEFPVVDVGTGSGCILIAILKNINSAKGFAVDLSAEALHISCINASAHHLTDRIHFLQSSLLDAVRSQSCSIIVSNPPYIPNTEIGSLQPEVRDFEPRLALEGTDKDGLGSYRRLAEEGLRVLISGGKLVVEVGMGQARTVEEIFIRSGYIDIEIRNDLANIERVVAGSRP